jgi:hypothetical protein
MVGLYRFRLFCYNLKLSDFWRSLKNSSIFFREIWIFFLDISFCKKNYLFFIKYKIMIQDFNEMGFYDKNKVRRILYALLLKGEPI